jgi:hypothetical protein
VADVHEFAPVHQISKYLLLFFLLQFAGAAAWKMLTCMPAFALKRYAEVAAGRELFEECYGKFTMHYAHHKVPNVEVSRWFEDEPGVKLEFDRPRENIGIKHPDDGCLWCVLRAGHEITVVYDCKQNSVTFLNMRGIFSLRNVSVELATWARAAERALPFTGQTLIHHVRNAFYCPVTLELQERDERPNEQDDSEYELLVGAPVSDENRDAENDKRVNVQSSQFRCSGKQPLQVIPQFFERCRPPQSDATAHEHSSAIEKNCHFDTFSLEMVKLTYEGSCDKEFVPSSDGAGDQELLELQLHDSMFVIVKVCWFTYSLQNALFLCCFCFRHDLV